jgi:hypothetical protein
MDPRSRPRLRNGREEVGAPPLVLRAGPVTALLEGADLRNVAIDGVELVQRVYVAVRDAPWNTIPATYSDWSWQAGPDRFSVSFTASHRYGDIAFDWEGRIEGTPDGVIRYQMDGTCRGVFGYSKIGFNVHHALVGSVGRPYRAVTAGGELRGVLPDAIDPQRIVGGTLSGMFDPYSELAIEIVDGTEAVVALEGDLLELQDHRNWTDANFKSYGTPLALGFPFDSTDSQRIRQILTISMRGRRPTARPASDPTIRLGAALGRLPALGFGMPSHDAPLSDREADLLRALRPDHLRVDVTLREGEGTAALDRAIADASRIGAALELGVFANEASGPSLGALAGRLRTAGVRVARVLVYPLADGFSAFVTTTPMATVAMVRDGLAPIIGDAVVAGGTNQNFADINRDRPADPSLAGLCFSISPTVHAADDRSIVENLAGQSEVVRMARTFGERAICISPVTIATRFGPYPDGPAAPGDLPPAVDVRQASLLGAGWTVGSIAELARAGAASVTYYETTGWRGVIETDAGSPMPDRFPSLPGQVFPMYHTFADLADWKDGRLLAAESTDPLRVTVLAIEDDRGRHLLVANVTPDAQRVRIDGLAGTTARVRTLDDATATWALDDPGAFRAWPGADHPVRDESLWLEVGPLAVARVDAG